MIGGPTNGMPGTPTCLECRPWRRLLSNAPDYHAAASSLTVIDERWLELNQLFSAVGFRRAVSQEIIGNAFLHAVPHPSLLFWSCIIRFCFPCGFFLFSSLSHHRIGIRLWGGTGDEAIPFLRYESDGRHVVMRFSVSTVGMGP